MKAGPAKSCPACGERYDTDVLFCPRDGTPLASTRNTSISSQDKDPYIGVELPGQIRIDHLIGIGSMGRVYRAFQGGIERDVAVKVLHRELSGNAELTARFHREAKVASRLVHPNVVQVLMTGAMPEGEGSRTGGELYLVMEHLDGISLLSALAAAGTSGEGSALPLPRALHIVLQLCDAVGEAHAQGIVHRDIKPENVMLVRRGDDHDYVKVLDFGIARLDWADRGMATQAGLIFGTAKYISPEGAEGQPVGPAADVYSIATMLYQMLAGRTPFEGDSPVALLVQHSHTPPADLRSIVRASYVPAPLAATIMQNLAKKPGERAQNARLFAKDLIAAARASGLYPEEIASPALYAPSSIGSVKLASKERTRSHELSADLAAKIGGVAARPAPAAPPPAASEPARARAAEPARAVTPAPTLPSAGMDGDDAPPPAHAKSPAAPPSTRRQPSGPPGPATMIDGAALDGGPASTVPGAPLGAEGDEPAALPGPLTTMQGTETTLEDPASRPRRARRARLAAILACALVAMPVMVIGGWKLGWPDAPARDDTLDGALAQARDHMRAHAWDAPPGHNFKDVTDRALARWHDSAALADLRREAAAMLVTEALGRKYANDVPEATHLAGLALHFDPQLTTAQRLVAELAAARAPDVAPASSQSASPDRNTKTSHRDKGHEGRDAKGDPRVPVTPPPPSAPKGPGAAGPGATGPASTGAVLPPPPAPRPPGDTPAPQPTGPWL